MKFIYITCNISMLEQMESLLREVGITMYQIIPRVMAESHFDIPHKDTAVWPGYNAILLVQEAEATKSDELLERIKIMNEQAYNNSELVTAYLWSVDASVVPDPVSPIDGAVPLTDK
ncbi:MAG: hypothetical protein Q4E10_03825 [Porphyromonas sp.]|nr:hypothetical protein [Porphyromonas sp.]